MLKRLKHNFLHIKKPPNLPDILKKFPISFGTQAKITEDLTEVTTNFDEYDGFLKAYEVLLTSIATNTLENLEGALEFNFLRKLQTSLKELDSHGFKLKLSGDVKGTNIYSRSTTAYCGPILPFRNLMMPSSKLSISKIIKSPKYSIFFLSIPDREYSNILDYFDFDKFEDFNFEIANKQVNRDFSDRIVDFHNVINLIVLKAENEEIIYKTNFKLLVFDNNGKLVSGNDDDVSEMHSGIFEKFSMKALSKFFFKKKMMRDTDFYTRLMEGYLENYVLVDFDMFMGGNPPIPKNLID